MRCSRRKGCVAAALLTWAASLRETLHWGASFFGCSPAAFCSSRAQDHCSGAAHELLPRRQLLHQAAQIAGTFAAGELVAMSPVLAESKRPDVIRKVHVVRPAGMSQTPLYCMDLPTEIQGERVAWFTTTDERLVATTWKIKLVDREPGWTYLKARVSTDTGDTVLDEVRKGIANYTYGDMQVLSDRRLPDGSRYIEWKTTEGNAKRSLKYYRFYFRSVPSKDDPEQLVEVTVRIPESQAERFPELPAILDTVATGEGVLTDDAVQQNVMELNPLLQGQTSTKEKYR